MELKKYDVFLSFRGEDTRIRFTDHLYEGLKRKGICTFRDENGIQEGVDISHELCMTIEASSIAVVVFSENFATSTWCLEELVKIFQCKEELGLSILPVFYDVDPSNVRKQRGSFGEAFVKHEANFGMDNLKVGKWRQVLSQIANLKGWTSRNWSHESEMIEEISDSIWKKIKSTLKVTEEDQLVGINSKLKLLTQLLDNTKSDNVVFVGIHGMGGMGKTTIARAIYDIIQDGFEIHCFLSKVRDISQKNSGLPNLQNKLLSMISQIKKNDKVWDSQEGLIMIKRVIFQKKVLLVLDDVDQLDQINGLIPNQSSFGYGSRIIITTRNADLLSIYGVETRFKMEELTHDEALQLLSISAFMKNHPKEGFLDPSKINVKLLGGHPLAIKVLGTSLRNKDLSVWNDKIEVEEGVNHDLIFKSLKISYDGLDEKEKEIFLDIACFLKGKKRDIVVEILNGCGFFAKIRVELLIQKSLISLSHDNKLQMHDLLEEFGRQIVLQKSIQNRIWCRKDLKSVVTEAIQSIFLKSARNVDISILFSRMHKLRLLNFENVRLQNHSEYCIPSELRYLKWKGYPLEYLSLSSEEYEIIELHMCYSNLKQFWKGEKNLEKLKYIKFSHSQKLLKTPDLTKVPNLEKLDLEGCTSLVNIHPSIFTAKRLKLLSLKDCSNLPNLPISHIQIEVLSILILSGCSKIKKIPEFSGNTERLLELYLDHTSIKKLPPSLGNLNGLILLSLKNCNKLISIPNSIQGLKSLISFDFSGCVKLKNQPKKLEDDNNNEDIEELDILEERLH